MRTYAIVALLSLFIITWVAWWQSGRLLSPLRALRRTADEISATDLSRRVPETGNDDITALTRTVNGDARPAARRRSSASASSSTTPATS